MENLYRILNCSETASFQELKKSYQSLALQYHPDKSQLGQVCSENFVRINRAWKVLSDTRLREQYDARWRERCLAQAYPVQDSVDFDEFEELETYNTDVSEEFRGLQESRNSKECKPDSDCELLHDKDVKNDSDMDRLNGDCQSTETNPEETEINTSVSDEVGSRLSDTQNKSTGVQGLLHGSRDNTIYKYDCRCGGSYVLTDVDVQLRFDIVCCDTCSLSVQVIYDTEFLSHTIKMQQFLLISALICMFSSLTFGLNKGEVAYKLWQISDDVRRFYVTDGNVIIKATTSKILDDMTSCSISWNAKKGQKLLERPGVLIENIGENQIILMKQKCGLYQTRVQRATNTNSVDSFNHDLVKNKPFEGDFETGAPSGAGSHFAIFPGTKWCGYENVAEDMKDLGIHNATDACCRTHDHCPYYIDRFETKYHYFNHDPWTLSHCDCDQHLYDCLKKVNTPTSKTVGKLFFGLLDVQCFTFKAGEYCSSESILSHLWCSKKNKGMMAVLQQFPHKWSDDANGDETSTDLVG